MKLLVYCSIVAALVLASNGLTGAQTTAAEPKHFKTDTLSFDYPSDWRLTDSSVDDMQYFSLTSADRSAQIAVVVQRDPGIA